MVFSAQQKALCVVWYARFGSQKDVRIEYCRYFNLQGRARQNAPSYACIKRWYDEYQERGHGKDLKKPKIKTRFFSFLQHNVFFGKKGIVGPVFFVETMNGARYLQLLQQRFAPVVQEWQGFNDMIFMQDGATPHWDVNVRNWLNVNFRDRWMGRGSWNLPWPPYSPDLTPCDYFLWGHIKDLVYTTQPSLNDLQARIQEAFDNLPQEMINRAIDEYPRRLERCIDIDGQNVEQEYADEGNFL